MIRLPWPDARLSPNARLHWRARSPVTRAARTTAYWLTEASGASCASDGPIAVHIVFHPPDRRKRDLDGMLASCKAYLDGMADAVRVNDNRFVLTIERGEPVKGGVVVVTL